MENFISKGPLKKLDVARLIAFLAALFLFAFAAAFRRVPEGATTALRAAAYVCWGFLILEQVMRILRMNSATRRRYAKFRRAEICFLVLSLACLPLGLALGSGVFCLAILLKAQAALAPFNDEKVFQVIANSLVVLLVVVFVFPFLHVIAMSFSGPGQVVNLLPKGFDLFALQHVFSDKAFFRSMGISVLITAIGTVLSVLSMSMAAYPLSKPRMPLRKTVMLFFVIVMLFTGGMAPNILLMNTLGLTNTIWALIFPSVVQVFYLILLKGFFEDIPVELEESARLDGANNYTILFRIIFPVAAPIIATVTFFTVIHYWNNINNSILYITSNQAIYPLPMYIRNFLNSNPMEIAMTKPILMSYWDNIKMSYILVSIIPVLILYPFSFRYIKNGVSMGAVKG